MRYHAPGGWADRHPQTDVTPTFGCCEPFESHFLLEAGAEWQCGCGYPPADGDV